MHIRGEGKEKKQIISNGKGTVLTLATDLKKFKVRLQKCKKKKN